MNLHGLSIFSYQPEEKLPPSEKRRDAARVKRHPVTTTEHKITQHCCARELTHKPAIFDGFELGLRTNVLQQLFVRVWRLRGQ